MSPANRLRLFYFAYYGSVGAYLPYFAAYLRGLGFSGEEIGGVQMLSPLVAAPAALLWATAVDRFGSPGRGVALATALGFAAIVFLPFARTPLAVAAVLLVQAIGDRAVLPLVDSVTVEWVKTQPRLSYARIRLFGSLGYGSSLIELPQSTFTFTGTGCHTFCREFHCSSVAEVVSEAESISSEKVAMGSMSRLTPVCPLSGAMLSLPSELSVSRVGALLSILKVKEFGGDSWLPSLSIAK